MPIVRIQMAKGRSEEEKTRLMKAVTDAIHAAIDAPLPSIHVMVQEIPDVDIMIGGERLSDKQSDEKI